MGLIPLWGPRAGSGNGTRSRYSLKEGGHRGGSSSRKGVRVIQPVLHSFKEGWRFASHFRSASIEPLSQQTDVPDAYTQTGRVSNQVRGLVCHVRSFISIHPYTQLLDDWLILALSERMTVQHQDVVLAHMKVLGLRLNAKKSVLSPLQRTTYLAVLLYQLVITSPRPWRLAHPLDIFNLYSEPVTLKAFP